MIQYPDDVYDIKISTRFGSYFWTGIETTPFASIPLQAARFHDMQNALSIARQLNLVHTAAADRRFCVALCDYGKLVRAAQKTYPTNRTS